MKPANALIVLVATLFCGCVSFEGTYIPGCIAYEGERIELHGGRFTWEKFTDQVMVDEDGNIVNQFPGFPKRGNYRVDGQEVSLETEAGELVRQMYLYHDFERRWLLTGEQNLSRQGAGEIPDCALTMDLE